MSEDEEEEEEDEVEEPPTKQLSTPPLSSPSHGNAASPLAASASASASAVGAAGAAGATTSLGQFRRGAQPPVEVHDGDGGRAAAARREAFANRLAGAASDSGGVGGSASSAEADTLKMSVLDAVKRCGPAFKWTPLEKQVIDFKTQTQDAVLLVECGYRFRFFGEDAEIAAKVLNVFAFQDHHFMTASIPTHRLRIHVGRLVAAGYKVGVVSQTETAALKAVSATKSAPFARKLTALYTRSTFIDDVPEDDEGGVMPSRTGYLLTLTETLLGADGDRVEIAIVGVQPATGDVVYDQFVDGVFRTELETRLAHLQPTELLRPPKLSRPTERLLTHWVGRSADAGGDGPRVERLKREPADYGKSLAAVNDFLAQRGGGTSSSSSLSSSAASGTPSSAETDALLADVTRLPRGVTGALATLIGYLREFGLERVLRLTRYFTPFASRRVLALSAATLKNLEILQNETDGQTYGSLLWILDHTRTPMGKRLLRKWVAQPLRLYEDIVARLDAVAELAQSNRAHDRLRPTLVARLQGLLPALPDLERLLIRVHYSKLTPKEALQLFRAFEALDHHASSVVGVPDAQPQAALLQSLAAALPRARGLAAGWLSELNAEACEASRSADVFARDHERAPAVAKRKLAIARCHDELAEHLNDVRKLLGRRDLEYRSVSGTDYLIEVELRDSKKVPSSWMKVQGTKQVERYHSPFIIDKTKELARHTESLGIEAAEAWAAFLRGLGEHYETLREVTQAMAAFDCLASLATVAAQATYCRPEVVASDTPLIDVVDGRHPMVEAVLRTPYVPNDTHMDGAGRRVLIVTGPNMGGKSSYIRQVALMVLMTQIGSFVPATEARIGIVDGVYTRMGASDDLAKGRSTFMMEMQETADILRDATSRSLVILDELGRGTSTHDGVAIAYATLQHFITDVRSLTLFVTHYPSLAELEDLFPQHVGNFHMSFVADVWAGCIWAWPTMEDDGTADGGADNVTFLYKLVERAAQRSYGLNVARLADLPTSLIAVAREKSRELETAIATRQQARPHLRLDPLVHEILAVLRAAPPLSRSELASLQAELHRRFPAL